MTPLTLALRAPPEHGLDLGALLPSKLAGKSAAAIARLRLPCGKRQVALGELFTVTGTAGETLRLTGVTPRCRRIGLALDGGRIEVRGSTGDELGREMSGGVIEVRGDTGEATGAGMRGGIIRVSGSAGARTGGVVPGATRGMSDGLILIGKNTGDSAGERMRRGVILVGGDAGAMPGDRMIAGTLAVLGRCGDAPGLGMRRGTVLLACPPRAMTATFNDCGSFSFDFIPLLCDFVRAHHRGFARRLAAFGRARRWCGDLAWGGKGEILVALEP